MSSSFSASTRFQSVCDLFEVAAFFILRSLPRGYDADNSVGLSMGDRDHAAVEQSERDETLLAVVGAVGADCDRHALEQFFDSDEVDPVLAHIRSALGLIPFKFHTRQCNYKM